MFKKVIYPQKCSPKYVKNVFFPSIVLTEISRLMSFTLIEFVLFILETIMEGTVFQLFLF